MSKLMAEVGYNVASSAELEIAKDIKEKHCYISLNPKEEEALYTKDKSKWINFELPDKSILPIGTLMYRCPEALFNPLGSIGK